MGTKTCTKCNIEKDFDCFHKEKKGKFGLKSRCKDCHLEYKRNNPMENEYNRRNYLKYQEKKKAYSRKYKEENAEQVKQYNLEYNARPIVKLSKRIKNIEYEKQRMKNDPVYKLRRTLSSKISQAITGSGYTKRAKAFDVLGVSYKFVRNYLERQFQEGMSWDNYGEWQIDHIKPLSSAETEQDVINLNHYTNLQPLWSRENREKNNKIIEKQLKIL